MEPMLADAPLFGEVLQAVQMVGFSFEGQQHRAVADVVNSAKILQVMKDPEQHRRFQRSLQTVYNSQQEFAVSIGDLLKGKLKWDNLTLFEKV